MLRFSRLLIEGLKKRCIDCSETYPSVNFRRFGISLGSQKWLGYADKFLVYPRRLRSDLERLQRESRRRKLKPIVHVVDQSNSPYLKQTGPNPTLLTCHDVIAIRSARGDFPNVRLSATGRLLQATIRENFNHPTRIACLSHSTRRDLIDVAPETKGREEVVHSGLPEQPRVQLENQSRILKLPIEPSQTSYLLHVGNDAWYKNRKAVVEGFLTFLDNHSDEQLQLVLVGPPLNERLVDPRHRKSLFQFASRIHVLTGLNDDELGILYKNAFAFAFPSLIEGFGWPPLEAQAHGCPVIASRAGSLDEILGDSVLTIDPRKPHELCEAIARLQAHPEEYRHWSAIGRKNAARFPFSRTVERYEEIYRRLANGEK